MSDSFDDIRTHQLPTDIQEILRVDPLRVREMLEESPGLLAKWGAAAVYYESAATEQKEAAATRWGQVHRAARDTLEAAGKKVTEKTLEVIADLDADYLALQATSRELLLTSRLARVVHDALVKRHEALFSMAADLRSEYRATPR